MKIIQKQNFAFTAYWFARKPFSLIPARFSREPARKKKKTLWRAKAPVLGSIARSRRFDLQISRKHISLYRRNGTKRARERDREKATCLFERRALAPRLQGHPSKKRLRERVKERERERNRERREGVKETKEARPALSRLADIGRPFPSK